MADDPFERLVGMKESDYIGRFTPEQYQAYAKSKGIDKLDAATASTMRDQMHNTAREMGLDPEGLMKAMNPEGYARGKKLQARMEGKLVPFLDGIAVKHSKCTTQGVVFVSGDRHLTMSVAADERGDDTYNMELYDSRVIGGNNSCLIPEKGFAPRKCYDSFEELARDIVELLDYLPPRVK